MLSSGGTNAAGEGAALVPSVALMYTKVAPFATTVAQFTFGW
jgi:hypothetical protein